MTTRSKFFRIAVEGGTTDGRSIDRSMIEDAVANFDTANYTPRINCEHIAGFSPEPPFNAYGSVTAVRAEEIFHWPLSELNALPLDELFAWHGRALRTYNHMNRVEK